MRILVVGAKGNMGRRYCAVLRHLKEDVIEADLGDLWWEWEFDRVIIATPTNQHVDDIRLALAKGKPILCEKPICKSQSEHMTLAAEANNLGIDVRMVSNWRFALTRALMRVGEIAVMGEMDIQYKYYHTGNDGLFWDCIQLLMMAGRFRYDLRSPVFDCTINGIPVTLDDISHSYLMMISEWLHGDKGKLWSLEDAAKAVSKVNLAMDLAVSPEAGEIHFAKADAR